MRELIQAGYGYALALTHTAADAEDLVHEAWLRLASRGNRRPDRPLLFATIRNLYIDSWRRRQAVPFDTYEEGLHAGVGASAENQSLARIDLDQALAQLRAEEREAIFLQAVQGYTAVEAAKIMNMPRGTVLSLIHRGKQKLRSILHPTPSQAS